MKYLTILAFITYFGLSPIALSASSQFSGQAIYIFSALILLFSYYWAFVPAFLVKKHLNNSKYLIQFKNSFVIGLVTLVTIYVVDMVSSLLADNSSSLLSTGNLQVVLWTLYFIYVASIVLFVVSFIYTLLVGSAALRFYEKNATGVSGNWAVTFLSYIYLLVGVLFISNRIDKARQAIIN